jgi:hypothetical protein
MKRRLTQRAWRNLQENLNQAKQERLAAEQQEQADADMRSNVTAAAAAAPGHVPNAPWPVESRGCADAQSFLDFCAARTVFDPSLNTLINEPAVSVPPNHAFQDVLNFERHDAAMGVIDFNNDEMLRKCCVVWGVRLIIHGQLRKRVLSV